MKRVGSIFLKIFAVGVLVALFSGALAGLGYMAALLMGGTAATELCMFIYNCFLPMVIRVCSVSVAFGLAGMYLKKMNALSFSEGKGKKNR